MNERSDLSRWRDERGSALVETPASLAILLLIILGFLTLVQAAWTHHQLADAVRDGARYATRADWDPETTFTGSRRRTEAEVQEWTARVASKVGVDPDEVTVVVRQKGTGQVISLAAARPGDEVVVRISSAVDGPAYGVMAGVANAAGAVFGARPFDPDGLPVSAEAVTYIE